MIRNREALETTRCRSVALDCIEAGIAAADPDTVVQEKIELDDGTFVVDGTEYELDEYDRVLVLGAGNAVGSLTLAIERVLDGLIDEGIVITDNPVETETVDVCEGDHPVPSGQGVSHSADLLGLAERAGAGDLVLALIGGGGSALLTHPADGVSLEDLRETTEALLASGAPIDEMNAVRKHVSTIKGGQLARAITPATTVGLVLSDVVGDDLSVVASGPTVPDESTYGDALDVLETYDVDVPQAVRERLERGCRGEVPETPSADASLFDGVSMHVIATSYTTLEAAQRVAADAGFTTMLLSSRVRGEAKEAAKTHVAVAEEIRAKGQPVEPPAVIVTSGETTTTLVDAPGEGGPNQEFALSAALELSGDGIIVASVDTDGIDGASSVAGSIVDTDTVPDGVDRPTAQRALRRNDALPALETTDTLVDTGPTTTNVNDLRVVVVSDSRDRT